MKFLRKTNFKNIISYLTMMLCIVFTLQSCGESKATEVSKSPPPPRPFPVVEVDTRDVMTKISFPAELDAQNNAQVRPRISGYVTELYVEEGHRVVKGQQLLKLETNVLTENASSAKSQIGVAEANVSTAQVEVDRLIPLVEKNIISDVLLKTAKAKLNQTKAQLNQTKAAYQSIVENINFGIVRSPVTGIVGKLNYRVGSLVSPQDAQPITTVSDTRVIQAYFTVNEKRYIRFFSQQPGKTIEDKIKLLPAVELQLADGSIYKEKGKVVTTTGQVDQNTGTVRFRADFVNSDGMLSDGNTGTILIPRAYKDVTVIPESATYEQQGLIHVYQVKNDSIYDNTIEVLDRIDNMVIVEKGLTKGDKVVAKGIINLRSGMRINPQPTPLDSLISIQAIK